MPRSKPLLIYDGECTYCCYSVRYARRLTGDAVEYTPYQQALDDFPELTEAQCRQAIQYVGVDGSIASGAQAAFRTLAHAPGQGFWLRLYRWLPGFAPLAELKYRFVSQNRGLAMSVSRVVWGREWIPPEYTLTTWLFLRLFALIYLAAFASWAVQWPGLVGEGGILPVGDFFYAVEQHLGLERYWMIPSLLWLSPTDIAVLIITWAGIIFSVLLFFNIATRVCLVSLWLAYLSLFYGGQQFMSFQWDIFLLECGFLAMFLPSHPRIGVWLFRWLLFRFMFLSGAVKLLSGDPTWANLTALYFHYETQPLPTPLAWYAHRLPFWFQETSVAIMFFIELVAPFLLLLPRRIRFFAAWNFIILEFFILLTGNYNFFNLLTILVCLLCFDDQAVRRLIPARWRDQKARKPAGRAATIGAGALAGIILLNSSLLMWSTFNRGGLGKAANLVRWALPLHIANNYGLFAVMTTRRPEIDVQGSMDGETWESYAFRYKPGPLERRPRWNIPHQPRLDWQMWFAALGDYRRNPWVTNFMVALGEGSENVLALLEHNPFPERPPKYLRAVLYNYRFTDPDTRTASGQWWTRELEGMYFPVIRSTLDQPFGGSGSDP